MTLGGVIYLLSIADKQMKGTTRRNIDMFHQICGDKALASVVLGTTNWDNWEWLGEDSEIGKKRERYLDEFFWKSMNASRSSKSLRFYKTQESAVVFVDTILDRLKSAEEDNVLQIQTELVELNRTIPETAAGKRLRYMLEQLLEMQKDSGGVYSAAFSESSLERQIAELQISLPRKIYLNLFVSRLDLLHIYG